MLISSLNSIGSDMKFEEHFKCKEIDSVRFNAFSTGGCHSPAEALGILTNMQAFYDKPVWVDLKGRQLRIKAWCYPEFEKAELNRPVEAAPGSRVYFRGDSKAYELRRIERETTLVLRQNPKIALGAGQAVNIVGDEVEIYGPRLTMLDHEFIGCAVWLGINRFMLSFVESWDDIFALEKTIEWAMREFSKSSQDYTYIIGLKFESLKGLEFLKTLSPGNFPQHCVPVLARGDLGIQLEGKHELMLWAARKMLRLSKESIMASRIFESLQKSEQVSLQDYADIQLFKRMGFKNFMLSDTISEQKLSEAAAAWRKLIARKE